MQVKSSAIRHILYRNHNCNVKTTKALLESQVPGHQLIHEHCDESKGVSKGWSREAQV